MVRDPQLLTRLARLRAEVAIDAAALASRAQELAALLRGWSGVTLLARADLMLVAINLHGYYTALETLCERIARQLDDTVPAGPTWHADLLMQMAVEVPGLRPAVLPAATLDELHELRKFRHFFRNAYVLEFDPVLVRAHAERVGRVNALIEGFTNSFRAHVDQLLAKLSTD